MRTAKTDQTDAQADLSLRWTHASEGTLSHVEANMIHIIRSVCGIFNLKVNT